MSKINLSLIIAFGLSIFVPLFLLAGHQIWEHVTNDEEEIKDIVLTSLKERYGEDFTNIEYIDYVQPINKHKLEAQSVRTGWRFNVSLDNGDLRDEYGLYRDVRETV
ncbi:hypothetical protein [Bacillus sp. KH172YL63]|uniref:hypothetical protein n=1 Tax=Bacillus sp. KH172YL63 TaxID=2709784 RepID=UPI0013E4FD02|nr:hypothetical protein [Bacillus sp. KH172YL63]BCB03977.1 hypothetical protein KH172YL63_21100 [Bacillus sp. KH172YL63]